MFKERVSKRKGTIPSIMRLRHFQRVLLAAVFSGVISGPVQAEDVTGRFGVTGLVGSVFPVAPSEVTSRTQSAGLNLGAQVSMQIGSCLGLGVSYENMDLGNGVRVSPINVLFMGRFMPESRWTPTFYFGPGSARGVDSPRIENFSLKAGGGVDYFINPTLAVGPQVNYYYISHSGGNATTYAHLISVNAALTYFFGSANGNGG